MSAPVCAFVESICVGGCAVRWAVEGWMVAVGVSRWEWNVFGSMHV